MVQWKWTSTCVLISIVLLASACERESHQAGRSAVRDSAGVVILEVPPSQWRNPEEWSLSTEPHIVIGEAEGAPEYQFFRISAVLRDSDGRILVADNSSKEIRFFNGGGEFLHSVGGEGEGPGEYRNLRYLGTVRGDSLIAWDPALRRGTILGPDGSFGRVFNAPDFGGAFFYGIRLVGDGSVVGMVDEGVHPGDLPQGILRSDATFVRLTSDGDTSTVVKLFGSETWVRLNDGRPSLSSLPFSHSAVYATSTDGFFYGATFENEIREYRYDGSLVRIVRADQAPQPLSSSIIDDFVTSRLESTDDPARKRELEDRYSQAPFPSNLPTFSELLVGVDGALWVARYTTDRNGPRRWLILDASGRVAGGLNTPPRFTVHEPGPDYVLGVLRDDLDIERVVLFGLRKAEG